jgi:tetratricopeptide (TPR) repeat protein
MSRMKKAIDDKNLPPDREDETKPITAGEREIQAADGSASDQATSTTVEDQGNPDTARTIPDLPEGESQSSPEGEVSGIVLSRGWIWLLVISLIALLAIAGGSAYSGYLSGIEQRTSLEATLVALSAKEQFDLGVQDIEAERYDIARQRFEYVIKINPGYPGVTEKLALVLLELNTTATLTPVPTVTLTPTPDMRGAEELYSHGQLLLAERHWTEAIETLLELRKNEPDYKAVKVDGMLYIALRNRGVQKILSEADLSGGTYDLTLAEAFGPVDYEASNYRKWADLYVTGASFWGLNWGQAVHYFGQIVLVAPNLRDATNITATERYRQAVQNYGDMLIANDQWCQAQELYQNAFNLTGNPVLEPTVTWLSNRCEETTRATESPVQPPPEETETPAVTGEPGDATLTPTAPDPYPPPDP